jgi:hypothetical protein
MDLINHPPHYAADRNIEPIDVLEEFFFRDALLWQVGKYLARYGRKDNPLQDLQKAEWYINRRMDSGRQFLSYNPARFDSITAIMHDWYSKSGVTESVRLAMYYLLRCGAAEQEDEAYRHATMCRSYLALAVKEEKGRSNDLR